MYIYILFLILAIWIYLLVELHKMMGKLNAVATGVFLTVSITTFSSNILSIQNALNETFGEYFGIFLFGIIIILVIFLMLISISFMTKSLDYIIHKRVKHTIAVKLSKKSEARLGGFLVFDVKFTSWLFNGYFVIHLQSPYLKEKQTRIKYDDVKKLGLLKGRYADKTVQLRCNIPNDWGHGKYDVTIKINDVCTWIFSLKKTMSLSFENFEIKIDR